MPNIVNGSVEGYLDAGFLQTSYENDYPTVEDRELDLRPGKSKLYRKLVDEVMKKARASHSVISNRFDSWREIDKLLVTYIRPDEEEQKVKETDDRRPTSIVFPYSYAVLETLLTYLSDVFLDDPIFRYEGSSPEDTVGAILMELVVQKHCQKHKVGLALHTQWRDALAYGIGPVSPAWDVRTGTRRVMRQSGGFSGFAERLMGREPVAEEEIAVLFEGNVLRNIDPYNLLPDPSVSAHNIQKGEFIGWIEQTNLTGLLRQEATDEDYFNCRYLKHLKGRRVDLGRNQSSRDIKHQISPDAMSGNLDLLEVVHMYIDLIPHDWELGASEYPEKWLFSVAAGEVIVQARPLNLNHGMFPVSIAAPDYDGYSIAPLSKLETQYGLQHTLNFLFNCYDDQTEVLTDQGWYLIKDAAEKNLNVATVCPNTKRLWFEQPAQWFEYDYDGYLLGSVTKRHDILVTPNHNVFGKYRRKQDSEFIPFAHLFNQNPSDEFRIPTTVLWEGVDGKDIVFPAEGGRYPQVVVSDMVMAGFLGWFLSDGGLSHGKASGSYAVTIKQSKENNFALIDSIMGQMGFHVSKYFDNIKQSWQWTITDRRLYKWLQKHCYDGGTTGDFKKVPSFVLQGSEYIQQCFLEGYILGDGYIVPTHPNLCRIGTESILLADGLQEVCLKLGISCWIRESSTHRGKPFWYLNLNREGPDSTVSLPNCFKQYYKGKVYCFENSTHLTLVRRNGKAYVCGQSHVANVRKAINDMLIVDPYMINIKDLQNPGPGKLIRMRRPAWGRGVRDAVMQLNITDITQQNISSGSWIINWMNNIVGIDESLMGSMRQGGPERLTKAEFQGTRQSAMTRLAHMAKVISMQSMQDIGYFFGSHTQQLMSEDTYVNTIGEWEDRLKKEFGLAEQQDSRMKVRPEDLLIDFDVEIKDGAHPSTKSSDFWMAMITLLMENPEMNQVFDIRRIFKHAARQNGVKNVSEFYRVQPDEQVMREVEKGNLIPQQQQTAGGPSVSM